MWKYISSAAQAAGSAPMFTWRLDSQRIELSGITFLNAVSKAANFIVDGLEVDSEQLVYVDLGNHWQAPVWQAAVLAAGGVLSDEPSGVNIVTSDLISSVHKIVAVVSRDPFGMPQRDLADSVINASAEVRGFGDHFVPRTPTAESTLVGSWGVDVQHARTLVEGHAALHAIAPAQSIGLITNGSLRTAIEWQCFFSIFNHSPMVLLDGDFDRENVEQQERITQIIDLR